MINVTNGKISGFQGPDIVYIGRGGRGLLGSPLANPYPITAKKTRADVIKEYEVWLWHKVIHEPNGPQVRELVRILNLEDELGSVNLACFCSPLDCHGRIIVDCCRYVEKN